MRRVAALLRSIRGEEGAAFNRSKSGALPVPADGNGGHGGDRAGRKTGRPSPDCCPSPGQAGAPTGVRGGAAAGPAGTAGRLWPSGGGRGAGGSARDLCRADPRRTGRSGNGIRHRPGSRGGRSHRRRAGCLDASSRTGRHVAGESRPGSRTRHVADAHPRRRRHRGDPAPSSRHPPGRAPRRTGGAGDGRRDVVEHQCGCGSR